MVDDDAELPFTLFVAGAQLLVGIGLIAFAGSWAVRIIGVVMIAFALLTGGSAWYHSRQRGQSMSPGLAEPEDAGLGTADEVATGTPAPHSTQGPRQPPEPEGSRSASPGPHEPGA